MPKHKILAIDDSPTILKILDVILNQAGYEPYLAHDGIEGIKLAKEVKPDLIILDFIMPKMNGFQVCKAIRKDEEIRDVPVILMSAKGDKLGDKFVDLMGAIDYLTKPFSPESLLSLIPNVLRRTEAKKVEAGKAREAAGETPPQEMQETGGSPSEDLEIHNMIRDQIIENFNSVTDMILKAKNRAEVSEIVSDVLSESLNEEIFDRIRVKYERAIASPAAGGISMKGLLSQVPLPEVFQFAKFQNHTGLLKVTDVNRAAYVFMRGGTVSFATFANPEAPDFLEKMYKETGLEDYLIQKAIRMASSRNLTVADTLVQEKMIDRGSLYKFLDESTREIIYEILTWSKGSFSFHLVKEHNEEIRKIDLGIMMDHLVMDGLRRVDELKVIQQFVHSDSQLFVQDKTKNTNNVRFTDMEKRVLSLMDGTKNLAAIKSIMNLSTYNLAKIVYSLLNGGYIQEVHGSQTTTD